MAAYDIEFNDEVKSFRCPDCGEESMTVWAWVSKDNAAYFANLMTGHQEISARLRAIRNCAGHARGRRRKKEDKIDHGVGLEFHKRIGGRVEKGESLATIRYNSDAKLAEASSLISAGDHVESARLARSVLSFTAFLELDRACSNIRCICRRKKA